MATKTPKKLAGRVTKEQKLRLLDIMKSNRSVGRGEYSMKSSGIQHEQCWKKVAAELNSISGGKKNPEQWKRCWIDWKAAVKRQYNTIKCFKKKTRNRPLSEGPKPLAKIDEELISFFSEDVVDGDKCTPEAGFLDEMPSNRPLTERYLIDAGPSTRKDIAGRSTSREHRASSPSTEDFGDAGPSRIERTAALEHRIDQPSQPESTAPLRSEATRAGSSLRSCFEEAKNYADTHNNAILVELRRLNENMKEIRKDLREIKEKLN